MTTYIKSVGYKNLKGKTEDVEIGKATMIVGRNFTGKTTITDAIKLALLGYHPSMDKTAKAIFELASGEELSVMVTTENGATIGRVWRRASGGSIAKKDFVPMNWPETPVVLLDANTYFGASDRGKAELLFGAINTGEWTAQLHEINKTLIGHGVALSHPDRNENIQAFVNRALDTTEKMRSNAAADAKRYLDTMQGLAALKAKSPVPLDEDVMQKLVKKRLELRAAEGKVADAKRVAELHSKTATADEDEMDIHAKKVAELSRLIQAKEVEIGKGKKFWHDLLDHQDCPMCGTKGETWRDSAVTKKASCEQGLTIELNDLKREKFNVGEAIKAASAKVTGSRKRLAAKDAERMEECEEVVAGLVEEVAALERSLEAYAQDQADRKRLSEAKESHDKQSLVAKGAEAAKKYLLGVKATLAQRLFEPIIKSAHQFTKGITMGPLQFEDGAIGMARMRGKELVFVHHSAFSGTEQAIVFAAFQAALATTAPIKLVIMDELGRVDAQNKEQLLRNVLAAIKEKTIDQYIGIDTEPPMVDGFTVVTRE